MRRGDQLLHSPLVEATGWCVERRRGGWQRYSRLTEIAGWCSTVDCRRRDEVASSLVLDGDLRRNRDLLRYSCIMKAVRSCVESRRCDWHRCSCLTKGAGWCITVVSRNRDEGARNLVLGRDLRRRRDSLWVSCSMKATGWCLASRHGDCLGYIRLMKATGWCLANWHSRGGIARDLLLGRDLWRRKDWLRHNCSRKLVGWLVAVASRGAHELARDWVLRSASRVSLLLASQSGLLPPLLGLDDLVKQFAEFDKDPAKGVSDLPGSGSRQGGAGGLG